MSTTMVPCLPIEKAKETVILAARHYRDTVKGRQADVHSTIRAHHALVAAVCVYDYAVEQQHARNEELT